ncbi:amidohydrolase family protein [Microvirga massiliensis]|uniref:amidohydrolase family protein n=1 Tax=Microvirga massiliensis TaxID=1033741 RepID=UPI00062BA140|nr:amidohydrolase family protein [Microvirga massiliensis]
MQPLDLVIDRARLTTGATCSICIAAGHIVAMPENGADLPAARERIDIGGALVLPGLIDGHNHLDTTFLGDVWRPHQRCTAGFDLGERLAIQKEWLARGAPLEKRASALIERAVSRGTTHIRTHVEVDPDFGLRHLEGIVALRERYCDAVSIQIVGLGRGLIVRPGTRELLDEALTQGADLVGGLDPAGFEGDIEGHLDVVFALAERHATGIDLHLHDGGHLGLFTLDRIAERTRLAGLGGHVAVSHAYALGEVSNDAMLETAERLAAANVAIMTNAPGDHPFPPIAALRAAGVTVFAGNDDIRDSWWPYGDGDMLERAMMIGYRSGFYTDAELACAFDMITDAAAGVLHIPDYGIEVGSAADLAIVDARHAQEAIVARPIRRAVYKAGRLVAREGTFLPEAGSAPSATLHPNLAGV